LRQEKNGVLRPGTGECRISKEMWQREFGNSLLSKVIRILKVIRPEREECVRTADLTQEKVKPSPDRRSST